MWEDQVVRTSALPPVAEGVPQPTASQNTGSHSWSLTELNSANNVDEPGNRGPIASQWDSQEVLANNLISAWWDPEQRAQTPGSQKLSDNKCFDSRH